MVSVPVGPVARAKFGPVKVTPEKLAAFCAALTDTCNVGRACKAVDIARQTAYRWREEMPAFAEAWDKAMKVGLSALEDEAHRRAFEGVDEPIVHQGVVMDTKKAYSDTLAIFLLKAHAPEKYRENSKVDLTSSDGSMATTDATQRATRAAALLKLAQARKALDEVDIDDLV